MKKVVKNQICDDRRKVEWEHSCDNGCCTDYETRIKVNDLEFDPSSLSIGEIIKTVLESLNYNVDLIETYNNE